MKVVAVLFIIPLLAFGYDEKCLDAERKPISSAPFENPETCTEFYQCSGGYLTRQPCPPGLAFNTVLKVCDYPANVPECSNKLDVIFLIDGSGSIGQVNFNKILEWIVTFVDHFDISKDQTRIGVIQYSHYYSSLPLDEQQYIETEIQLGAYEIHNQFNAAVREIEVHGFTTYTAHAMLKAIQDFETSDRFYDASTEKVLIVLSDGESTDRDLLESSAQSVHEAGIKAFAVAVGIDEIDARELKIITNGDESRVFAVADFEELPSIIGNLISAIEEEDQEEETETF